MLWNLIDFLILMLIAFILRFNFLKGFEDAITHKDEIVNLNLKTCVCSILWASGCLWVTNSCIIPLSINNEFWAIIYFFSRIKNIVVNLVLLNCLLINMIGNFFNLEMYIIKIIFFFKPASLYIISMHTKKVITLQWNGKISYLREMIDMYLHKLHAYLSHSR